MMKDIERIREEILITLLLILTLIFTNSNLTPESLENNSLAEGFFTIKVME